MSERKEYSNGEITVVWQPGKCQHAAECVKGSPNVFRPREKPWINVEGGTTESIRNTVHKCPSGALTILEDSK
ncbi:MAG: (4Fe-4S)-binding protein [Bacteroidia bacterium]|nr:(4Fe-4S)-binding protein [Bacteroidia bacterium]